MILRKMVGFLVHQVVSTIGVIVFSGMSWYGTVELLNLGRVNVTSGVTTFVLLGTPGFPFQAANGSLLGFALTRRLGANSVGFVWILPFLWFGFGAVAVTPTISLAYLLGAGCQANQGCFYQVLFTLPMVASMSYALGAAVSKRLLNRSSGENKSLQGHLDEQ